MHRRQATLEQKAAKAKAENDKVSEHHDAARRLESSPHSGRAADEIRKVRSLSENALATMNRQHTGPRRRSGEAGGDSYVDFAPSRAD